MLNRNDRIALRRNRAAVSWLSLILFFLVVWIISIYNNSGYLKSDLEMNQAQLESIENEVIIKNNKIDSLYKIIFNLKNPPKDTTTKTTIFKPKKVEIKDTNQVIKLRVDSTEKILKDSLK